jgi:hypothetical protein
LSSSSRYSIESSPSLSPSDSVIKGIIKLINGAPDEFFFQHIIVKDICEEKPDKCNVTINNLRFIFSSWVLHESVYDYSYVECSADMS